MDADGQPAFHRLLDGQVGHGLKRADEFRPAVGIARIVQGVDADVDVAGPEHLGPAQGHGQEDGVAGRHVGDRNVGFHLANIAVLGHVDVGRQRRAADGPKRQGQDQVRGHGHGLGHPAGGFQLHLVALAVFETERARHKSVAPGHGQAGGGIQAPGKKDHGFFGCVGRHGGRLLLSDAPGVGAPDVLVQLQPQAGLDPVGHHPGGQLGRGKGRGHGRKMDDVRAPDP